MQPKQMRVDGGEFAYLDQGSGPPVVLVHGSLGDFRTWWGQIGPLSTRYHVIAYSRRYHYPNEWVGDGSDYSAALHADDLSALIRSLRLGRVHVVAASFGAYTALVFAVRHPELVRTLVLGEPPLLPWLRWSPEGRRLLDTFLAEVWEPAKRAFRRWDLAEGVKLFVDGVLGPGAFDRLSSTARQMLLDNAREMQAEAMAAEYFTPLSCEDVGLITAPVLLLTGERSPKLFHKITDELERCVAHVERAVIKGASHGMHGDNPQVYTQAVLAFLVDSQSRATAQGARHPEGGPRILEAEVSEDGTDKAT